MACGMRVLSKEMKRTLIDSVFVRDIEEVRPPR
jgi:hypothetical protein